MNLDRLAWIRRACGTPRCRDVLVSILLAVGAVALLTTLHLDTAREIGRIHVQEWTSDGMMQTMPSSELKAHPWSSLWYLHKQPPGLDIIRALIAVNHEGSPDPGFFVDIWMYCLWTVFFAMTGVVVFFWLRRRFNLGLSIAGGLVWIFHPAAILHATLLEGTLPSALFIYWMLFELSGQPSSRWGVARLSASVVLTVFTRSIFQWFFLPVLFFALALRGLSRRHMAICAVAIILPTGALFLKQRILFGSASTSSFGGYHYCGMLWHRPAPETLDEAQAALDYRYPQGSPATRDPYNTEKQAIDNLVQGQVCKAYAASNPWSALKNGVWRSIKQNAPLFMKPSSSYSKNAIVERLPWRDTYETIFSHWSLGFLFIFALLGHIVLRVLDRATRRDWAKDAAIALVMLYILAIISVANRYAWAECERLKFMIEAPLLVWVLYSGFGLMQRTIRGPGQFVYSRLLKRATANSNAPALGK